MERRSLRSRLEHVAVDEYDGDVREVALMALSKIWKDDRTKTLLRELAPKDGHRSTVGAAMQHYRHTFGVRPEAPAVPRGLGPVCLMSGDSILEFGW